MTVECLPAYGGRILNLQRGGAPWTRIYDRYTDGQLRDSSEIYSGSRYESPGWSEVYEVVRQTQSAITMRASLTNGLELTREVSVESDTRVRERIALRNVTGEPREATLRLNPRFMVRDARVLRLLIRQADGYWREDALPGTPTNVPSSTDRTYSDVPPRGHAWGLYDAGTGQALIDHLREGTVERCFTHMDWAGGRITLELWSPTRTLAPGEEIVIAHEYECVNRWPIGTAQTVSLEPAVLRRK